MTAREWAEEVCKAFGLIDVRWVKKAMPLLAHAQAEARQEEREELLLLVVGAIAELKKREPKYLQFCVDALESVAAAIRAREG